VTSPDARFFESKIGVCTRSLVDETRGGAIPLLHQAQQRRRGFVAAQLRCVNDPMQINIAVVAVAAGVMVGWGI